MPPFEDNLFADLAAIHTAAALYQGKERCCVAPSPQARLRMKAALDTARAAAAGTGLALPNIVFREPRHPGLNDGVIRPLSDAAPGIAHGAALMMATTRPQLQGELKVLVVLVQFPDAAISATAQHFEQMFFSSGQMATGSVNEFYREASANRIGIAGQVTGPFMMPRKLTDYANNASGLGARPNAQDLSLDAFNACRGTVDFSGFDNDGDGFVDAFIVVHAGHGAEETLSKADIWSHKWTLPNGAVSANGKQVFGYLTVPEDAKVGVCAHELGHLLFGWPDLYDTTNASSGLGDYCLMAGGSWGGGGDRPCHPSAWCKAQQGWVQVQNQTENGPISLDDVKQGRQIRRLWTGGVEGPEYFLLENRQRTGFDESLPAGGLLLYHVDEGQSGNTNASHYQVGLLQADGKHDLEHGDNRGDDGDPFPGSTNKLVCDGTTDPGTLAFSGAASNVALRNISANGPTITADAEISANVA